MKNLNPIRKAKYIADNFKQYIFSEFQFEEDVYQNQFKNALEQTELLKGPYISKNLEFKPAKTLQELIDEGVVHPDFSKLGKIKLHRPLRQHQEDAIRKIADGRNLIVTTGTGSGKTEAFLYPIINEIMKEDDINRPGIRAIFLFPMNALVNDQFDRVRELLNVYPDIKYGFFTGLTKEKEEDSIRKYIESSTKHAVNENEIRDREEIRKNPPHILFTNFSMLEYILLRPKDDVLLDESNTDLWKFIVLDEAHVYKGALGIEVGMLLRRLQERIGHSTQFILTSATLGINDDSGIKKIQDYGYRLTSRVFEPDDILFSTRIGLNVLNAKYKIDPNDYLNLYNDLTIENVNALLSKYQVESTGSTIKEKLYDLIINDNYLYLLNDELDEAISFYDLYKRFENYGFKNEEQLAAFIELICKCEKNSLKIMDLKYHSFIRTINGAYITLGNDPKISLVPRSFINGNRAFEVGVCKKCNSMYIIGVINHNILYQNDDVDIYANYDPNEPLNIDFFLLEEQLDKNAVAHEHKKLEAYILCPKCGKIFPKNSSNIALLKCEHDDVEKVVIYKIQKSKKSIQNNITNCILCDRNDNHGIVHTVNMGKEASTALLAQMFFEAIDDGSIVPIDDSPKVNKLSLFRKDKEKDNNHLLTSSQNVKQILAFSDSRQQASFAVNFAEYNHHRMLRKRLLVEFLKINGNKPFTFEEAENKLQNIIEKMDLFNTGIKGADSAKKQAKITLLEEILNIDGLNSGEGLGLFYFENKFISDLIESFSEDEVNEWLFEECDIKSNISKEAFGCILHAVMNEFRYSAAIDYDGFTFEEKKKYFSYRMYKNYVTLKRPDVVKDEKGKEITESVKGLISRKRENRLEVFIEKVLNVNRKQADKLIEIILKTFAGDENNRIIDLADPVNSLYTCSARYFSLHSALDCKWYYCSKCKKITRFNPNNVCINCRSKGTLQECDPNEVLKYNYYRKKYIDKKIEKLVYYEHTAQLSSQTAEERQQEFKNKKINLLSCSTTFEMGIDIGSLENVLLRNVPPSPANYVQRAGRAGRGRDTSAFVLTFCSTSSHDFNYFLYPETLVNGICETPVFAMKNYKVIIRHLLAVALSLFFRKYPLYFNSVGSFYFDGGFEEFKKYLLSKPKELIYSSNKILLTSEVDDLYDGVWIDKLLNIDDEFNINFDMSSKNIHDIINDLENGINNTNDQKEKEILTKQKEIIINDKNLVSYLSDNNMVPKYGFPTDLVELKVIDEEGCVNTAKYDLTRDIKIALSEYCPGSEIMVDKQLIVSKYINKRSDLLTQYYYDCPICHKTSVTMNNTSVNKCNHCGYVENNNDEHKMQLVTTFVTPKYGFTGLIKPENKNSLKPKKTYTSPIKYIGNGTLVGDSVKVGDVLEFFTVKNDEMLIINESNFYTCRKCGFSVIKKEGYIPYIMEEHNPLYRKPGEKCNEKLYRENYGVSFKTDVLKMVFSIPVIAPEHGISFLYALLEGVSLAFDIERKDIDGIFLQENDKNIIVLFDTVPGGAGHVKRLLNYDDMIKAFKYAHRKVDQDCCDSACYTCLKNYHNQRHHRYLDRFAAKDIIEKIISKLDKQNSI